MNMRKSVNVWLCAAILLLVSCSDKERDYRAAIPADAGVVLSIDLKSLAEKCGADGEAGLTALESFLKENMDVSSSARVLDLVKNPAESGLDFSAPVYVYYVPSGEAGLVVKVSDGQKVETLWNKLCGQEECPPLESKSGVHYAVWERQAVAAFSESALLLAGGVSPSASLAERGISLLKQEEEQSFLAKKELFEALGTGKGDVAGVVSYASAIPASYLSFVKSTMPEQVRLSDVGMCLSLAFEKGRLVVESRNVYTSDAAKEWAKKQDEATMPLKGLFLPSKEPAFWMGAGIKGDKLFDRLKESPRLTELMEPVEEVLRKLFAAMEGDFSLSVPCLAGEGQEVDLNVELKPGKEDEFVGTIAEWLEDTGMPYSYMGDKSYSVTLPFGKLAFGLDADSRFYLTWKSEDVPAPEAEVSGWTDEVKGKRMYGRFDLQSLSGMLLPFMASQENVRFLELFDCVCVKAKDGSSVSVEIVMKNREENALKQLAGIVGLSDE